MALDHIGVATEDATAVADRLGALLDAPIVHRESFDGLFLVFLDVGGAELELLEPVDNDGIVAKFLDRYGPGLHHLAFGTASVSAAIETARAMGIDAIDETPRPGARGHTVAFVHPATTGGVLIEFVER